jgi:hypothetical protein
MKTSNKRIEKIEERIDINKAEKEVAYISWVEALQGKKGKVKPFSLIELLRAAKKARDDKNKQNGV